MPEKLPFCRKIAILPEKVPFQLLYRFSRCHLYVTCFFPTCFRFSPFQIEIKMRACKPVWLKGPQLLSHMIMTINVYFTYYCGYRTHLNKSFLCHFKPQKPLEMTIKAHSAVLNVHFYHHLHLPTSF